MSNKETIVNEIEYLFRTPTALLFNGNAFKVVQWGRCKSYLTWPDGAPEGWDDLPEKTEYMIGKCGDRLAVFIADSRDYIRLYAADEKSIEEVAENICYELDLEEEGWE